MKKLFFYFNISLFGLLFLFFTEKNQIKAQDDLPCGTEITVVQKKYLDSTRELRQNYPIAELRAASAAPYKVPIKAHIVRQSNGTGGLALSDLHEAMQIMNDFYINADIEFFLFGSIQYINSDTYYDFSSSDEDDIGANDVSGVINIYFFNSVTGSSGNSLCGYAKFPPSVDRIIMSNGCTTNGSTLSHEVGHYFSLYHTHGDGNCSFTDEYVDRNHQINIVGVSFNSCLILGDELCDTEADPNLVDALNDCDINLVNSSCVYTGTYTDNDGDLFVPDPTNVMSYSRKACRTTFTSGQYDRVLSSLLNDRNYLICDYAGYPFNIAYNLTSTISGTAIWRASNAITASNNINSSAQVIYSAGQQIILEEGFDAYSGTDFDAYIVSCGGTGKNEGETEEVTAEVFEEQASIYAYPNPLSQRATLVYKVPHENTAIDLELFAPTGQKIRSLVNNESHAAGEFTIELDASNLPAGVYYYAFYANETKTTQKLVIVK